MDWARVVGKITGSVDEHLLQRNRYLLAENHVLRSRLEKRPRFTDPERPTLATAAKPLGRAMLAEIATLVTPDTLLRWHRRLVEKVTPNPDENRMKEIARNVTMAGGFVDEMKYLNPDRDGTFAPAFRNIVASAGVKLLRLPLRSPNLNAFAKRFVRST